MATSDLKSETIDLIGLAKDGARDLAAAIYDADQCVEKAEVIEERGRVYVSVTYIETDDREEETFAVVECANEHRTEMWFKLEEI